MKVSVNSSGTSVSLPGLERLRARMADLGRYHVEVGVPSSARYADGESVAQVFAWNEFGTDRIPSRPALRTGARAATPKAVSLNKANLPAVLDGRMAAAVALAQLGEMAVSEVRHSILTGPWDPNSEATIRRKGSSKPLVDTGQMLNSVSSRVVGA